MQMSIDYLFLLFVFTMTVLQTKSVSFTPLNCGKEIILSNKTGIIQTPNFPNRFPVPIRCRWVIDSSVFRENNKNQSASVIYIYFTQLFITSGLNITEYVFYDREENPWYGYKTILDLSSERTMLEVQLIRTNLMYLVVDFALNMVEGNHIRVLSHLMNVYGFNITYEISTNEVEKTACTVTDCSLVGHCYASADYSTYECSCFDGFSGSDCGYGPLCRPNKNKCANNATCRYAGETTAICECTKEYTGAKCDIPVTDNTEEMCLNVTLQCKYDEKINGRPCKCNETINEVQDRVRYSLTVALTNSTIYSNESTSSNINSTSRAESVFYGNILEEFNKYFRRAKLSKFDSVKFLNAASVKENCLKSISFSFFASKSDFGKIQETLTWMIQKNLIANVTVPINKEPTLQLVKIGVNVHRVLEGEEFILSCVALGSSAISFQWYKDGVPINVSLALRGIWSKIVQYNGFNNKYTALLGIQRSELFDSGKYTCQVRELDRQQCVSISINVIQKPKLQMKPLNIVVEKGQNVSILCLSTNEWQNGEKFAYVWLKNDELLKMNVPHLYWEDLFRDGSILHVNNVQRSEIFKCSASGIGRETVSVRIDVLNRDLPFCKKDEIWMETGAGMVALQQCPEDYSDDVVRRQCIMVDADTARWQLPDFSSCVSNTFISITENFRIMTLGYQNDSITTTNTLRLLWQSISKNPRKPKFLPGEGESYVKFLNVVYKFLTQTKRTKDFLESSIFFLNIVDVLLQETNSIINDEAVYTLSHLIEKWISSWAVNGFDNPIEIIDNIEHRISSTFVNDASHFKSFEFHALNTNGQIVELYSNVSVKLERFTDSSNSDNVSPASLGIVTYKNLSHILLSKYVSNHKGDKPLLYELSSPIVHVLLPENAIRTKRNINSSWLEVDIKFRLPFSKKLSAKWDICCGLVPSFGKNWNLETCSSMSLSMRIVRCTCSHAGLFALFAAEIPFVDTEINRRYHVVVLIGCAFCIFLCGLSFCVLLFRWLKIRSCLLYLKIQICASTAAAMSLFLYGSSEPSPEMYPYILCGLQIFLLVSISSHISVLKVMYIDIVSLKKIPYVKISAVSVMTISPMLLIVFAPLSRKITKEKLTCWWLCKGTLLFYIHFIVGLFFLLLFIFLYYSVMKKLLFLWNATKIDKRIILQRISLLYCTSFIFLTTIIMIISSICYVNTKTSTSQCVFGFSCILLGFLIFIWYIPKTETMCFNIIFPKSTCTEPKYSPELQIVPVQSDILCNDSNYETESSHSRCISDSVDGICYEEKNEESPRLKKKKSVIFQRDLVTECTVEEHPENEETDAQFVNPSVDQTNGSELNSNAKIKFEPNILWPVTPHNYISTSNYSMEAGKCCNSLLQNHPEMLTTRVCVELGVVKNPDILPSNENASTVVICSVDVEPCPGHIVELNEVKFTTNTLAGLDVDKDLKSINESFDKIEEDKTDVLDQITQDLDYLLNRSPSPMTKMRTKSKTNQNRVGKKTKL